MLSQGPSLTDHMAQVGTFVQVTLISQPGPGKPRDNHTPTPEITIHRGFTGLRPQPTVLVNQAQFIGPVWIRRGPN